jgi:tripeptidyl-peptidase-1
MVSQGPYAQWPNGPEGFGADGLSQWVKLNSLPSYVNNVTIFGSKADAYTPRSTGDVEAQLDMQMQSGIGQGAQHYFAVQEGWMYEFGQSVFADSTAPWVISMSYGWPEENQCEANVLGDNCKGENIPGWKTYLVRAETEFLKITATGRTIIASSGDTGAPGDNNNCDSTKFPLHPGYPATGAWLLSVGGTTLANTAGTNARQLDLQGTEPAICQVKGCVCSTSTTEETCTFQNSDYTAGGGFSLIIPQPRWQQAAVATYLASGATVPAAGKFNSSMRAFPDVTGIGENVLLIGPNGFVGGTSASCPLWAGLVSLLNDYRFNNGLKPMGHIAPLIYTIQAAHPDYFNDITTGCNQCTESGCCQGLGYCATTGWDPVTGFGTPNFPALSKLVTSLP